MTRKDVPWTEDETDRLKQYWTRDGFSSGQISKIFHTRTRRSVIGKLSRLGLLRSQGPALYKLRTTTTSKALPTPSVNGARVLGAGKSLGDLGPRECKWPVGDMQEGTLVFCAAPCECGNYCPEHRAVAYIKAKRAV